MVRSRPPPISLANVQPAPSTVAAIGGGFGNLARSSVGQRIPGFYTSAAFLTSLSANLRIDDDDLLPSPMPTPPSLRSTSTAIDHRHLPPPSPLAYTIMSASDLSDPISSSSLSPPATNLHPASASNPQSATLSHSNTDDPNPDPLADIPALTTVPARTDSDRLAALRLISDSVAQQRQTASRAVIFHPAVLGGLGVVLALVAQWRYRGKDGDLLVLGTTFAGIIMSALVAVRWLVSGYVARAEEVAKGEWLDPADDVLVTWFGDELIAALAVRWAPAAEVKGRRRKVGRRGLIRAWTTKLKYRGKGVGSAILEEAVLLANSKGAEGIDFDADNVYAPRVLPNVFNGVFDKRDDQALTALQDVATAKGKFGKRRSRGSF